MQKSKTPQKVKIFRVSMNIPVEVVSPVRKPINKTLTLTMHAFGSDEVTVLPIAGALLRQKYPFATRGDAEGAEEYMFRNATVEEIDKETYAREIMERSVW